MIMMEISTRDFGPIRVDADALYAFPEGIYGFEEEKQFALVLRTYGDASLLYLQSTVHPAPCFLVFDPGDLCPGYQPTLSAEDLRQCGAEAADELVFLTIATVRDKIEDMTINLKSPIAMNPKKKTARQVILQDPDYLIRYRPFDPEGKEGASC